MNRITTALWFLITPGWMFYAASGAFCWGYGSVPLLMWGVIAIGTSVLLAAGWQQADALNRDLVRIAQRNRHV